VAAQEGIGLLLGLLGLRGQVEGHERVLRKEPPQEGGLPGLARARQHDDRSGARRPPQARFGVARDPHSLNIRRYRIFSKTGAAARAVCVLVRRILLELVDRTHVLAKSAIFCRSGRRYRASVYVPSEILSCVACRGNLRSRERGAPCLHLIGHGGTDQPIGKARRNEARLLRKRPADRSNIFRKDRT